MGPMNYIPFSAEHFNPSPMTPEEFILIRRWINSFYRFTPDGWARYRVENDVLPEGEIWVDVKVANRALVYAHRDFTKYYLQRDNCIPDSDRWESYVRRVTRGVKRTIKYNNGANRYLQRERRLYYIVMKEFIEVQNHICALTGRKMAYTNGGNKHDRQCPDEASLDHIVSLSDGGRDILRNYAIVTREANSMKERHKQTDQFKYDPELLQSIHERVIPRIRKRVREEITGMDYRGRDRLSYLDEIGFFD